MKNLPEDTWLMSFGQGFTVWLRGPCCLLKTTLERINFLTLVCPFCHWLWQSRECVRHQKFIKLEVLEVEEPTVEDGGWGGWGVGRWCRIWRPLVSTGRVQQERALQRACGQEDSGASPVTSISSSSILNSQEPPPLSSYKLASMKVTFAQEET